MLSFLYSPTLTSILDYWKTIALARWTFIGKVMSLLFNMLSRLVMTFLPRINCLLILWLHLPSAVIFGAPQNKVWHCCHSFPIYLPWSDGTKCHDLHFLNVEFKLDVSLSFFIFITRLFSFSSSSAMRVVTSAYLRLLIFLPANVIPACALSGWAFHMMYSAYNLNKQGDNIQPLRTPFLIWSQYVAPSSVLTVASWPAYRFLRRQVR